MKLRILPLPEAAFGAGVEAGLPLVGASQLQSLEHHPRVAALLALPINGGFIIIIGFFLLLLFGSSLVVNDGEAFNNFSVCGPQVQHVATVLVIALYVVDVGLPQGQDSATVRAEAVPSHKVVHFL